MKYYDEVAMAKVRSAFEATVLPWRGVKPKAMMGCLCYFHGTRFFAFLMTDAVVITKLSEEARARASEKLGGKPFEMAGRVSTKWVQVPVKRPGDLTAILPFVKASYETAVKG